jgi:deoxycytidine triphosphate deaminase
VTYTEPYDLASVGDTDIAEAKRRADFFRTVDPFPELPPALLSSEHILDYVRVTAMIHPFYSTAVRLKSASYEVFPKRFIRWDDDGSRLVEDLGRGQNYRLPPNSITFVQLESALRLPNYIALRFNLRIKHVHRGLLLGTGPLVDPGFAGELLIPLHNLTSEAYEISSDEGIIWIEFTKTSHDEKQWPPRWGTFYPIQQEKTNVGYETYFERANGNNPIQSSIPSFIKDANQRSREAARSARKAANTVRLLTGLGVIGTFGAVLATALALHSYFQQMNANIIAANTLASSVGTAATQAASDAKSAQENIQQLKRQVEASEAKRSSDEIQRINAQLDQAHAEIESLRSEFHQLTEQIRTHSQPSPK